VSTSVSRYFRAFGAFWYDFLIGDRPELFVGSIAVLAVTWVGVQAGLEPGLAGVILTLLVVCLAAASLWRASRPIH
jgi:hypothetical protein